MLSLNHAGRGRAQATVEVVAPQPQSTPPLVAVHVVGAVRQPGLYWLPEHSRVSEAVALAGGLSPEADPASVNLAGYVQDGDQVKVAFAAQPQPVTEAVPRAAVAAPPPATAPPATVPAAKTTPAASATRRPGPALDLTRLKPVSLTNGSREELDALPGVGGQLAAAIIQYRTQHGPFRSVDDLMNVPGFGDERVETLRPYVVP